MNETNMTLSKGARKTSETDILLLLEWASDYERDSQYPKNPFERFAIGLYQTSQAEGHLRAYRKHGNESALTQAWEAFAACSLHLMMVVESVRVSDVEGSSWGVAVNFDREGQRSNDHAELLYRWGRAQQIVLYWWVARKVREKKQYFRSDRINLDQLSEDLWFLIHHYRACIPKEGILGNAIYQATDSMCGRL